MSDPAALLPLAESIADGTPVDWHAVEGRASDDEQGLIRQLRILSNLAVLHRSLPANPNESSPEAMGRRSQSAPAIGNWAHLALIERLGSGTFGEVYRAWDRHLEREVALKLLRVSDSAGAIEDPQSSRIAREGRLLARVRHPNVITVHGVEVHEGRVGLCMELIRGTTLEQLLLTRGPFSAREASLIGIDVCRALASIHASGLIHRDVKAQNILREDGGRIVLMDLGTGREIDPEGRSALPDLAGTPLYLAPEIFDGAPASERTDLYSLGVLLYHLVTGSFPVRATSIDELREGQATGAGVRLRDARPDLPTAFVRVVDRAMAADPSRRHASVGALEADLGEALDEPASRPSGERSIPGWPRLSWRTGALAATVIGALALAVLGARLRGWPGTFVRTPAAVPGHVSLLAVLPFQNLSADAGEEYLANAVPMELTARLGQIGAVKVVPWTFMKAFDGPGRRSLKEVAERTGADAVIEGSVQRVPAGVDGPSSPVHVRVQVYQASSGTLIWSDSFERGMGDFFALQAQIAQVIAARINVVLAGREQMLLSRSRRVSPEAMELYLKGRQQWASYAPGFRAAVQLFQSAIDLQADFAEAYAGLADCYVLQSAFGGSEDTTVALPRAMAAADRAIAIDPGLPDAWSTRGFAKLALAWDWNGAAADFQQALRLDPNSALAHNTYSNYLTIVGRHSEALDESLRAEERDPFSTVYSRKVGWAYYMGRQYDAAITQLKKTLTLDPTYLPARTLLGRAYLQTGRYAEGIRELEAVKDGNEAMLAQAYAAAGRKSEAERMLHEILDSRYVHPLRPYQIALAYATLGDAAEALNWLERAYTQRDPNLAHLAVDPMLDAVRDDPRFITLEEKMRLRP